MAHLAASAAAPFLAVAERLFVRFNSGFRMANPPPLRLETLEVTEHAMNPFLWLIDTIISLYIWILVASAVLSWLVVFNVVNTRNPIVHSIGNFLYAVTEPLLRPIRNIMPNLGGIDISPVILIIGLLFIRQLIFWLYLQIFI